MTWFIDLMRDYFTRILGGVLLVAGFVTLLMAPPKPDFSIANFLLFIAFVLAGTLLVFGLWGLHPVATRLRREARRAGPSARNISGNVTERVFRYCPVPSWKKTLGTAIIALLGLFVIAVGFVLAWSIPGTWPQRLGMGLPAWLGGGICLWVPLRQRTMFVKVDAAGLKSRGYFRTVEIRWEDVVALIVREHSVLIPAGFVSAGTVYSVYSQRKRVSFLGRLPDAAALADLISSATGLKWQ